MVGSSFFTNRLRYVANLVVSRSSVDQSIAIKGAQPSNEVPFQRKGPGRQCSCPPIRMLVFPGSTSAPIRSQIVTSGFSVHAYCTRKPERTRTINFTPRIPETDRNHSFLHSPRNENAKNDARSSEIKISFGNEGGIDQTWCGKIIGAATLA